MLRELDAYFWDVLTAIRDLRLVVQDLNEEAFLKNRPAQLAAERSFEIIGEALRQARTSFPDAVAKLPGIQAAIGMRNHLAHGYFSVRHDILWKVISGDLPELEAAVRQTMQTAEPTQGKDSPL